MGGGGDREFKQGMHYNAGFIREMSAHKINIIIEHQIIAHVCTQHFTHLPCTAHMVTVHVQVRD